jgi:hypothetical protein
MSTTSSRRMRRSWRRCRVGSDRSGTFTRAWKGKHALIASDRSGTFPRAWKGRHALGRRSRIDRSRDSDCNLTRRDRSGADSARDERRRSWCAWPVCGAPRIEFAFSCKSRRKVSQAGDSWPFPGRVSAFPSPGEGRGSAACHHFRNGKKSAACHHCRSGLAAVRAASANKPLHAARRDRPPRTSGSHR